MADLDVPWSEIPTVRAKILAVAGIVLMLAVVVLVVAGCLALTMAVLHSGGVSCG